MKEVFRKPKIFYSTLPRKIANPFNNFSINISPNLADDIRTATRSFESFF